MPLLLAGVLLWIYAWRIADNPLTWEEPRRSLIALEMMYGGDYIVPHVLGQPYLNKPPLQNWLIVLLAGNDPEALGPMPIRLISLLSLAGTAWCLWVLGGRRDGGWRAVLVFLTMGIVVQYGRSGELDALFTFWVVAALTAFEVGRRRGSPWLEWGLSQILLAGGILTKGISPLFFYPPVALLAWKQRPRHPPARVPLLVGLAAELAVVLAWLIPYSMRSSAALLAAGWKSEILMRTPLENDLASFVRHLGAFPFEAVGAVMPWSLAAGFLLVPRVRRAARRVVRSEPAPRLAVAVVVWSAALFWLMPGSFTRYLLPAFAMGALLAEPLGRARASSEGSRSRGRRYRSRNLFWTGAGVVWGAALVVIGQFAGVNVWPTLVAGWAGLAAVGLRDRTRPGEFAFSVLLSVALLYGVYYAGISRVLRADREVPLVEAASEIAASITETLPVVCAPSASYRDCFIISRHLGRPLGSRAPQDGAWLLVDRIENAPPPGATRLAEAPPLALWRID